MTLEAGNIRLDTIGRELAVGGIPIPVHVHHLRRQLELAGANLAIHTIRGVGYILAETTA